MLLTTTTFREPLYKKKLKFLVLIKIINYKIPISYCNELIFWLFHCVITIILKIKIRFFFVIKFIIFKIIRNNILTLLLYMKPKLNHFGGQNGRNRVEMTSYHMIFNFYI